MFKIGPWWYLVFSTFSDRFATHYRMAQSPRGPWMAPADDAFDARAFYAAKSAGDGSQRFLCGWLSDRLGRTDDGGWEWGGNLVVHEICQRGDGTLGVRPPEAVVAACATPVAVSPRPVLGEWRVQPGELIADSASRFSVLTLGALPETCLIDAEVSYLGGVQSLGLLLRASADLESYYQIRLEPPRQRMVIDRWPRAGAEGLGPSSYLVERPLHLEVGKPLRLRVLLDGSCLVVYAGDVALSCRLYDHPEGGLGVFVAEGQAEFRGLKVQAVSP
jgi:beta-fructofuranosidase